MSERTLVLIKPDAVRRGLVGEVLARFERKGLAIVSLDLRTIDGWRARVGEQNKGGGAAEAALAMIAIRQRFGH